MHDRTILHVDCNSFFCSVSLLYRPQIQHLPVAVGGSEETRHGIILAKNEHAKKYKIKTGMALWQARQLCKDLVIIPPDYHLYQQFSDDVRTIFSDYTDMIEPFGSDECWLDVTGSASLYGDGETIGNILRHRIKHELGITVSVGVSWNKIFAKLGSDYKKPDALTIFTKENYKSKVWPLPVEDLLYVGPATQRKLNGKGVYTIGDLAVAEENHLTSWFGVIGKQLLIYANGWENSPVGLTEPPVKSVGNSSVIDHDVTKPDEVRVIMHWLAESVGPRMREHGFAARTIKYWVCDNNMGYMTRQRGMQLPSNLNTDLAEAAFSLFQDTYKWHHPIRKVGISGSNLVFDHTPYQCCMWQSAEEHEKRERLEAAMDGLNKRWPHSVKRAITMFSRSAESQQMKDLQRMFTPVGWY